MASALQVYHVTAGKRYRMRVISNAVFSCPIQFSVDGHNMTMIASDGKPFEPFEVISNQSLDMLCCTFSINSKITTNSLYNVITGGIFHHKPRWEVWLHIACPCVNIKKLLDETPRTRWLCQQVCSSRSHSEVFRCSRHRSRRTHWLWVRCSGRNGEYDNVNSWRNRFYWTKKRYLFKFCSIHSLTVRYFTKKT